jgi:hypothetical protein
MNPEPCAGKRCFPVKQRFTAHAVWSLRFTQSCGHDYDKFPRSTRTMNPNRFLALAIFAWLAAAPAGEARAQWVHE